MARRPLLSGEERRLFFGVPVDPDAMARQYTFTRSDLHRVAVRRGAANRLGFAVQLALVRHPGIGLAQMEEPIDALVGWLAAQLDIPPTAFADYGDRPQTMTDHALLLAGTLGLRPPSNADLPLMIEAAARSAWSTDRGQPIVAGVIAALRAARIILPAPTVIERTAIALRCGSAPRPGSVRAPGGGRPQHLRSARLADRDDRLGSRDIDGHDQSSCAVPQIRPWLCANCTACCLARSRSPAGSFVRSVG